LLESWLHFRRHDLPVIVQEEIHSIGHDMVAIEQVVQVYTGMAHVQVHVEVTHTEMNIAGLFRQITFVLNSSYDINVRPITMRQAVPSYGQQQDLPVHVVVRDHLETREKQFQSNAIVIEINSEKHEFRKNVINMRIRYANHFNLI